jgi:hypothetical protein
MLFSHGTDAIGPLKPEPPTAAAGFSWSLIRRGKTRKLAKRSARNLWLKPPLRFGRSDEAADDRMPIEMAEAGNGATGWVIGSLQDLIEWYPNALTPAWIQ